MLVYHIFLGFGMTELCGASHNLAPDRRIKPGSVGVLMPNLECKVSLINKQTKQNNRIPFKL